MPGDIDSINALLLKLQQLIVGPTSPTGVGPPPGTFISFCSPGIAISKEDIDFGYVNPTPNQLEAMSDFSDLVNATPPVTGRFVSKSPRLTEAYGMMLRDAMLPEVVLTNAEKNKLKAAYSVIYREIQTIGEGGDLKPRIAETPLVEHYKSAEKAYIDASLAYKSAQLNAIYSDKAIDQAKWAMLGPTLKQMVISTYNQWLISKNQVEQALGIINTIGARGPEAYWNLLKAQFKLNEIATMGGVFYPTKYFPSKFWDTASGSSWVGFSYNHEEEHKINEASQVSIAGGGGFGAGLWNISAGGSYAEQKTYMKTDTSKSWLKAKITQVSLRRSWFDSAIFRSRAWKFDPNINSTVFSDGGSPPKGEMPAIITGMILAKDVSIGVDWSSTEDTSFASQLSVNTSAGWGPFSIRGNYSRNYNRTTHDFVKTGTGLEAAGMQIIAFVCEELPKLPNPDLNLKWPN